MKAAKRYGTDTNSSEWQSESVMGEEPVAKNVDELVHMIKTDELQDAAEAQTVMTPIDYAKARGVRPQMVYYWIRRGHIKQMYCACGRNVIEVAAADRFLASRKNSKDVDEDA